MLGMELRKKELLAVIIIVNIRCTVWYKDVDSDRSLFKSQLRPLQIWRSLFILFEPLFSFLYNGINDTHLVIEMKLPNKVDAL